MKKIVAFLLISVFLLSTSAFAESRVYGDAYSDGKFDMKDLVKLAQFVSGADVTLTDVEKLLCDVDRNMIVEKNDLVVLSRYMAKIESVILLPIPEDTDQGKGNGEDATETERKGSDAPVIGKDNEAGAGDVFG